MEKDFNDKITRNAEIFNKWAEAQDKAWKEYEKHVYEAKILKETLNKKRDQRWKKVQVFSIIGCTLGSSLMLVNLHLGVSIWIFAIGLMAVNSVLD